jgi:uncharacterized membrane protein (UPF0182 family)
MFKNRGCAVGLVLAVVLVAVAVAGLELYTDLAWFETLGITSVFWKRVLAEWALFLAAWGRLALCAVHTRHVAHSPPFLPCYSLWTD